MIVMDPAIAPVTIVLVGAGTAILVVIHRVNMIPMQAATIRALSLTAGRDRTKNTEGVTSATIQPAFPARTARHAQRRVFATPPASPATLENTRTQGMSQAALPAQQANTARQMLLAVRIVPTTPSLLHPI